MGKTYYPYLKYLHCHGRQHLHMSMIIRPLGCLHTDFSWSRMAFRYNTDVAVTFNLHHKVSFTFKSDSLCSFEGENHNVRVAFRETWSKSVSHP